MGWAEKTPICDVSRKSGAFEELVTYVNWLPM